MYIHTNSSVREMLLQFLHLSSDAIDDDEDVDTVLGGDNEGVAVFKDGPDNDDADDDADEQENDDDDWDSIDAVPTDVVMVAVDKMLLDTRSLSSDAIPGNGVN